MIKLTRKIVASDDAVLGYEFLGEDGRVLRYDVGTAIRFVRQNATDAVVVNNKYLRLKQGRLPVGETLNYKSFKHFVLGKDLAKRTALTDRFARRPEYATVKQYLTGSSRRVLCVYGLRRTGKTVLLLQTADALMREGVKVAYAELLIGTERKEFLDELRRVVDSGVKVIIVDEATYLDSFPSVANVFSRLSESGVNVILSGTDSLQFGFAASDVLYDRLEFVRTTFLSYSAFSDIARASGTGGGVLDYVRTGGILSDMQWAGIHDVETYVETALVDNLIHTFEYAHRLRSDNYAALQRQYSRGTLRKVIQQFIMYNSAAGKSYTENLIAEDVSGEFSDKNLGSALDLLKRNNEFAAFEPPERVIEKATGATRYRLLVSDALDSAISNELLDETTSVLMDLDVLTTCRVTGTRNFNKALFQQPALRYAQAEYLFEGILESVMSEGVTAEEERGLRFLASMVKNDIEGRVLEDMVLVHAIKRYGSNAVSTLRIGVKEVDVMICQNRRVSLFEVKRRSAEVQGHESYRWLVDKDLRDYVENKFGTIDKSGVIWLGDDKKVTVDGIEISYINAERFLRGICRRVD